MAISCETLIHNVSLATCRPDLDGLGVVRDGVLAIAGDRILYAGSRSAAPAFSSAVTVNGAGGWLTPGLIDCHTHLVWGGSRVGDFQRRLEGASYAEIAAGGGGILGTVRTTRDASEQALVNASLPRLAGLLADGVTTVEIKSGYGLDTETECRLLRVARRLGDTLPVTVRTTLLAAHAVPEEYTGRAEAYVDLICEEIVPAAVGGRLADAVDAYCETIAFTPGQCARVFEAAKAHGLPVRLHAEQLSDSRGAVLAAEHGALSADHLEYLAPDDVAALRAAGTVAVLLPGAFYFLGETQRPPLHALRDAEVPVAVATDLNPGTSPIGSLLAVLNMACICFGLTPDEALLGVTRNAARALALGDRKGQLASGFDADVCLWPVDDPAALSYGMNLVRPSNVWQGGSRVESR